VTGVMLTYMDDLVVPSTDFLSGVENLKSALRVASEHGLSNKFEQMSILTDKSRISGSHYEDGNIQPSEYKTKAAAFSRHSCIRMRAAWVMVRFCYNATARTMLATPYIIRAERHRQLRRNTHTSYELEVFASVKEIPCLLARYSV
jgi:hypothetical protein